MAAEARIARRLGWPVGIGSAAADGLIAAGARVLVSFGLAGGLDPALRPGTIVVPTAVLANGECHITDPMLSRLLGGATGHVILGGEAVAATLADKRHLFDATKAAGIDLESAAVARIASSHDMPFAVLRAICDPADRALPPAALAALDATGTIGFARVVGSILRHPGQIPALLVLATDAVAARRSLLARVRQIARDIAASTVPSGSIR